MPSRTDGALRAALLVLAAAGCGMPAVRAEPLPARERVQAAADEVRRDPNLPGLHKERQLRLKPRDPAQPRKPEPSRDGASGWADFMASLSSGARLLVWALGGVALLWFLWRLRRWAGWRADAPAPRRPGLPSHVGALDIRPGSLPADVGAAAAALWRQGQGRPALSLLYRGALSRLVNGHAVPIRAASTEGECLALSAPHLPPAAQRFLGELVTAWQTAAYSGTLPQGARVLALCARLDAELPAEPATLPDPGMPPLAAEAAP